MKAEGDEFWARVKAEGDEFWARVKAEGDERRARARAESDEFWARVRAEGDEFWGKIDREREESKERDDRDRAAHEVRADRDSDQNARDDAQLASAVAALQGDVNVLLGPSNCSSGDEAGGGQSSCPYEAARQATPDQCEDDAKSSSDQPVAQPPVGSAAENPAD